MEFPCLYMQFPYNFYALLTIFMMVAMVLMKVEFGAMGVHETNALKGDIYTTPARPYANAAEDEKSNPRGKVIDLLIPIVSLVICCVIGMIYTGGFFSGTDFVTAFSQSDASVGLVLGSFFGLVITIVLISDTSCYEFQRLYGVYSGRIQGNGTCNPDPYFCLDIEGHDRQPWCICICICNC